MEPDTSGLTAAAKPSRWVWRVLLFAMVLLGASVLGLMWWWDKEPAMFDMLAAVESRAKARQEKVVIGTASSDALVLVAQSMLQKRGGYLSNDVMPPGAFMDNIPNWEFGVLVQCRDLARAFRNGFSRSQTQSIEDKDLQEADPLFSFSNDRWILPSSENQFRAAIRRIRSFRTRLQDDNAQDAQFFARADNLSDYLAVVEGRLGSLSQRLSASVGHQRINTDLAMDRSASQSTAAAKYISVKTPWQEIDDVFYEARGTTYALGQFLKAIEYDFAKVLDDKNARVSLQQIIRELEESQAVIRSPMILNGSPFGFFANHSLVMANYISRANAALIDLRKLLDRG